MKTERASLDFYKIHNYFVGEEIACGSFSSIRTAIDNQTYEDIVIKLISKRRMDRCPCGIDMFFAEAYLAPLFSHPHIVKIKEVVETPNQIMQAMDFYKNGDLFTYVQLNKIDNKEKLRLIYEILEAIEYLHSRNLCHRDIKPENVLLTNDMSTKLTDFGFTIFSNGCMNEGVCGSEDYLAPEIKPDVLYDGRMADIWSLGKLIYAVFRPEADIDVINYRELPRDVANLVESCLVEEPKKRPTISQLKKHKCFEMIGVDTQGFELLNVEHPINNFEQEKLIILSEMYDTGFDQIEEELKQETINEPQIVYNLLMKNIPEQGTRSLSSSELANTFRNKELSKATTLEFDLCPNELISILYDILFKYNFCVSTSVRGVKTIVLNRTCIDLTFNLELELLSEKTTRMKFLYGNESSQIINELTSYLKA